jgi:hypothetical protein
MALTIDVTVAGDSANSYADVTYADAYWSGHYNSIKSAQWAALTTAKKTTALIHATRIIEFVRFTVFETTESGLVYDPNSGLVLNMVDSVEPVRSTIDQSLQFPRNLDYDSGSGTFFIPEGVKMAQCEQAVYLLTLDEGAIANRLQGIVSESVGLGSGQISVSQSYVTRGSFLSPVAVDLLKEFMVKSAKLRRS